MWHLIVFLASLMSVVDAADPKCTCKENEPFEFGKILISFDSNKCGILWQLIPFQYIYFFQMVSKLKTFAVIQTGVDSKDDGASNYTTYILKDTKIFTVHFQLRSREKMCSATRRVGKDTF